MSAFLYACSVQGIQDFIFQSNVLKEIIGASELVKCVENLAQSDDKIALQKEFGLENEPQIVLAAAGNLRVIFKNEADCAKVVRNLPKFIATKALNCVQAVVRVDLESPNAYKIASKELERRLKAQRNKPNFPQNFSFALLKQNPKTALPLLANKDTKTDASTFAKLQAFQIFKQKHPNSTSELAKLANDKGKIAIIYADGNGLGKIVKTLDERALSEFSFKLDRASKKAFNTACERVKRALNLSTNSINERDKKAILSDENVNFNSNSSDKNEKEFQIRELICGGDDLVIICNANIALQLVSEFLDCFENLTQGIYKEQKLTSCAGIAFCNHKYPIHYALKLAKDLCKRAKIQSKALNSATPPSSLMFHNIQSSRVQGFDECVKNELVLKADTKATLSLDFGAYFLRQHKAQNGEKLPTIHALLELVKAFRTPKSPSTRLREWLSIYESNAELALRELEQINRIFAAFARENETKFRALHEDLSLKRLIISKDKCRKTPIYDIISLLANTKEVF